MSLEGEDVATLWIDESLHPLDVVVVPLRVRRVRKRVVAEGLDAREVLDLPSLGVPEVSTASSPPSVRSHSHRVPVSIGKHAERHAGHLLSRLDDSSAKLLGPRQRCFDIVDPYEEEDSVRTALQGAYRRR